MKNIFKQTFLIFGLSILYTTSIYGQYPLSNRLFFQNKFGINVAYAGEMKTTRLSLVGNFMSNKLQEGDTSWQQFTVDIPLGLALSTGTRISNLSEGFLSQQVFEQALGYKIYFSSDQTLSFGLSFGIIKQVINNRDGVFPNEYVDRNDPLLNTELNQNKLRLEFGVVYKQGQFEFSLAVPSSTHNNITRRGITAYAGYNFYLSDIWKLNPSVLMMKTYYNNYELTTGVNIEYLQKSWLQLSYVNSKQLLAGFGLHFDNFGIGYNYTIPVDTKYKTINKNSHQLGLNYSF